MCVGLSPTARARCLHRVSRVDGVEPKDVAVETIRSTLFPVYSGAVDYLEEILMEPTDYANSTVAPIEKTIHLNFSEGVQKFDGILRLVEGFRGAVIKEHQRLTDNDNSELLLVEHHADLDSVPEIAQYFEQELSFTNGVNQVLGQLDDLAKKIRTERSEFRTGWHSIDVTDPQAMNKTTQRCKDFNNALEAINVEWDLLVHRYQNLGRITPQIEESSDTQNNEVEAVK